MMLTLIFIFSVAEYFRPVHPPRYQHLNRTEISLMKKQVAAKKAAEIEVERGKLLAFSRKPWYNSSYKRGKNGN